jgi:ATP-dependent Lhr-like helicase
VLDALWDLVWAGEVTNDTFAPLRALRWKRPARPSGRAPRLGRLTSLGPPEAAGRWSVVGSGLWDATPTQLSPTERMHQLALALLDRHGVLVRESVMAEGLEGGFSAVYPMLKALEEAGRIRRGYFVAGLGAAQFALAGALDRLRSVREPASATGNGPHVHLLAAADPANPYGAAVPWPRRGEDDRRPLPRAAGASVVLVDGLAALYLDRGGSSLQTLPPFDDPAVASAALGALRGLLLDGRTRELVVSKVDGEPVSRSRWYETLLKGGFVQGYRGLVMRKDRAGAMIA